MRTKSFVILASVIAFAIVAILWLNIPRRASIFLSDRLNRRSPTDSTLRINKISPASIYCPGPCIVGNIGVDGGGFVLGQHVVISHGKLLDSQFVSDSHLVLTLSFDAQSFDPGSIDVSVSGTTGITNNAKILFIGNTNTVQLLGNRAYNLDQGAAMVHVFDLSRSSVGRLQSPIRSCFIGDSLAGSIAVDDKTGLIVVGKSNFALVLRPDDCKIINVIGLFH